MDVPISTPLTRQQLCHELRISSMSTDVKMGLPLRSLQG